MPVKTPHFGLQAFVSGDQYSATLDRRRMTQIDSHLAFLSDIIGRGIIEGWELSEESPLVLSVSAGWGIVDRFVTRTFGPYTKTLLDNNVVYIWMRRRPGVVGQVSAFSNMANLDHEDADPPPIPTGIASVATTISSIQVTWDAITDIDFNLYRLFRSTDDLEYELIAELTDNTYLDTPLDDDTTYYYALSAIDKTGNESNRSTGFPITTDLDTTPPTDPTSIDVTNADEAIHLIWRPAPIGEIETYRAEVTPVTVEGFPIGDTFNVDVPGDTLFMSILGLTNGQRYKIVLRSIGTNGVSSPGVTVSGTPDVFDGPKDVDVFTVTDREGDGILSDIILVVSWEPFEDPYDPSPPAVSHEIQITEFDGQGGQFISQFIEVPDENFREFKLYPYSDPTFGIVNRTIRERTEYFILLRAIDADGNRSVGRVARYTTRSFEDPRPPTRLTVEQLEDQSLLFTWTNSVSIFEKNLIVVEKMNPDAPSLLEIIEDNTDIGTAQSYILEQQFIEANHDYELRIRAVDEFGNESVEAQTFFSIPDLSEIPRPPVPTQQFGIANDSQTTIAWSKPNLEFIGAFRIYRAEENVLYNSSDFTIVETVSGDTFEFTDYEADNDISYVYFVTTIDIYGRESLNPVEDGFFDYDLVLLTPTRTGDLPEPENLTVSVAGSLTANVDLLWDTTAGQFDGYEIFRSFNNKFSFEKVGTVGPSITSFTDVNALIQDGTYFYLVRKFRNEADLFVTESDATVVGALFIGTVTTENGEMTLDTTNVRHIKDLEDPIREETIARINVHKHEFLTEFDDRRINLADSLFVSDWTTFDFQNYRTSTDLSDATTFTVFLNGERPENLDIFFNLDKDNGLLTFERKLAPGDFIADEDATFPFESAPEVTVLFDNLTEVQNILPRERIEGASATQVSVGLIQDFQLPSLDHEGRIRERLIPVQDDMFAVDDGFRFAPVDSEIPWIGEAITWYDVILAEGSEGDVLLASTSDGIYTSEDFGLSWVKRFTPITPVIKFFYSPTYDFYFALTNRGVLGSGGGAAGGFSVWNEIRGMENAKVARDIVEDNNGEVLCSADIGVFKLVRDVGRGSFFWEQTPIFGPASTESFAMLFDDLRSRIIVSNELGIFETPNSGVRWDFSDEFPEQRNIYTLWKQGDYIYALTRFMVWRRSITDDEFQRVTVLDDVEIARKLVVWRDRIFITTDLGVLVSKPEANIETDTEIEFEFAFAQMNRNSYVSPPTSMNIIDDRLFVGTEDRLFVSEAPGRMSLQTELLRGVIPTIYINGVEQRIGYRYTTDTNRLRKFVTFDEKVEPDASVTFARQYQNYQATFKGWTGVDYSAKVLCYIDGIRINDGSIAEKPAVPVSDIVWPTFNDRNAHEFGATAAFSDLQAEQTNLLALSDDQENPELINFNKENVRRFIRRTERFLSQLFISARAIPELDDNGNPVFEDANGNTVSEDTPGAVQRFVPFVMPQFRVALVTGTNTFEQFGLTSFGTYNEFFSGDETGIGGFSDELNDDGTFGNIGDTVDEDNDDGGGGTGGSDGSGGSSGGGGSDDGSGGGGGGDDGDGDLIPPGGGGGSAPVGG